MSQSVNTRSLKRPGLLCGNGQIFSCLGKTVMYCTVTVCYFSVAAVLMIVHVHT